jgi:glycosyltransferase involved in cell wall biosynthesis
MFLDVPPGIGEQLTVLAERSRRTVADSGLPVFVTTPDLLDDLPEATWAPLVVNPDLWACDRPVLERKRPLVLHAPSRRWTKGTGRILPVMKRLEERGLIEFRLVEGMPWHQMRELVQDADIILDQLVMGSYCTFACEGMAAGKPVIAFLSESAHAAVGVRPPIVNATPDTLAAAIESLLDDRDWGARLGAESVAYVREHHDGRRTAAAFADFLR